MARARALRAAQTPAEARLWRELRAERLGGWKWKRQVPYDGYFLDFLCVEARLVVELDGGHHADGAQAAHDRIRTAVLSRRGLRVLRFWNSDVLANCDGVCLTILRACGGERPAASSAVAAEGPSEPSPGLSLSLRGGEE